MKLSSNFFVFHNVFSLKETIDIFSNAGFEAIDFNLDLEEYYTDAHDINFYKEIRSYAEDRGIVFSQTHAPFHSSFLDEAKTKQRFAEIAKSFTHASYLGADAVVVHPCRHIDYRENNQYEQMLAYNYDFYKRLIPYAETAGVKIAIENIRNCITERPEGLIDLLNALDNDVFTVCFDVGHANYYADEDPAQMILKLGHYIGCTHIHDNDGVKDLHILPYYGTVDWEKVMASLAKVGYKGNLSYEAGNFVNKVPEALWPEGIKYSAKVGQHLIQRFYYYQKTYEGSVKKHEKAK